MGDLKGAQQTLVKKFMRCQASDVMTFHSNTPRGRLENPRDHVEQSGFSGTIWADQAGDRAFFDVQRRTIDGFEAAKTFVNIFNDNHCRRPPPNCMWLFVSLHPQQRKQPEVASGLLLVLHVADRLSDSQPLCSCRL